MKKNTKYQELFSKYFKETLKDCRIEKRFVKNKKDVQKAFGKAAKYAAFEIAANKKK